MINNISQMGLEEREEKKRAHYFDYGAVSRDTTNNTIKVEVKLVEGVTAPEYKTIDSAGCDLVSNEDEVTIYPGERKLVKTGLFIRIPRGFEGQVRPRSGLALNNGITVINAPGTIDADYRGEVGVVLINLSKEKFIAKKGDRIAQLVFARVYRGSFEVVESLDSTVRGDGGFGHTGVR